jgi:hypothetical protein
MSAFNATTSFNQELTANRVGEVHPNQAKYIGAYGGQDYQTNLTPIYNVACGCAEYARARDANRLPYAHPWNVSHQMQNPNTTCPYVTSLAAEPGDAGATAYCTTQNYLNASN